MRKTIFYILLTALLAACSATETAQRKPHEHIVFPELKEYEIPEPEQFTYNGITFFLLHDDELPLVDVRVIANGGSWMDPAEKAGLASVTGQVLRSGGSVQFPEEQLDELLENRAASMETGFGLTTGFARMNVLKEDFDELLPVFTDLLKNPTFPESRIDLAMTQRRTAISRRNEEASQVAAREFRKLIYGPESVYARTTEYATLESITRDDLVAFHSRVYQGSNMLVGLVGDFNPADVRSRLEEAFGIFDEGEPAPTDLPDVDYEFEDAIYFAHKSDMNQSQIRMGHIGGFRDNPDYAALQVMNQILSGGFSGRLMQEVRTAQGLAYGVYGSYTSNVRYPGAFFAGLSTSSETTREALEATIYQIERLQNERVTQQELDETKERIFNSIIFRYDSNSRILSERMNNYNLGLPDDTFEQYIEQVRTVTVDDIYRVANEYIRPGKMKVLIVGNRDLIEDQLAELGPYHEVDITIPRAGAERELVEGDAEAGSEWIRKMASALIADDAGLGTVLLEGTQTVQTPQGEMSMGITAEMSFPATLLMEISTPMGSQVIDISEGSGVIRMGGQEHPLPGNAVESILNELKRDPLNIARNAESIEALLTGDGDTVDLYLGGDYDMTISLDPETHLPVEMKYMQFDPNYGRDIENRTVLSNWNLNDGIRVAYEQTQYSGGELSSSTVYTSHGQK
ncbi:insulinase family protein [Balneolales bacterium ANBcel1]|nr:insulinase family protein [Balneolales bacterium ANBcel1]